MASQGNYIKEVTLGMRGHIGFFQNTFSHKVVSEIDRSLHRKIFFKLKSCIEPQTIVCVKCTQWHYMSTNTSTKQQFISHLSDSIQAIRCKFKNKPPTVWFVISF